eukprot:CAMPEP_0113473228 /NCGR_PEP_ID=MMETSP0014_2-20120614/17934_1 /TAXON_ID=2857 /ORGANISM="Nitzschia sp." /LENGTH=634 /DNA_ID=CAMNT_0000365985 /DNA_START=119 /DNA_END=2023 /DNA_ORIENTATION=+ /assembly_acc=CAM_ASM_000159
MASPVPVQAAATANPSIAMSTSTMTTLSSSSSSESRLPQEAKELASEAITLASEAKDIAKRLARIKSKLSSMTIKVDPTGSAKKKVAKRFNDTKVEVAPASPASTAVEASLKGPEDTEEPQLPTPVDVLAEAPAPVDVDVDAAEKPSGDVVDGAAPDTYEEPLKVGSTTPRSHHDHHDDGISALTSHSSLETNDDEPTIPSMVAEEEEEDVSEDKNTEAAAAATDMVEDTDMDVTADDEETPEEMEEEDEKEEVVPPVFVESDTAMEEEKKEEEPVSEEVAVEKMTGEDDHVMASRSVDVDPFVANEVDPFGMESVVKPKVMKDVSEESKELAEGKTDDFVDEETMEDVQSGKPSEASTVPSEKLSEASAVVDEVDPFVAGGTDPFVPVDHMKELSEEKATVKVDEEVQEEDPKAETEAEIEAKEPAEVSVVAEHPMAEEEKAVPRDPSVAEEKTKSNLEPEESHVDDVEKSSTDAVLPPPPMEVANISEQLRDVSQKIDTALIQHKIEKGTFESILDGLGVDRMCGIDNAALGLSASESYVAEEAPTTKTPVDNPTKLKLSSEKDMIMEPFGPDHDALAMCGKLADVCDVDLDQTLSNVADAGVDVVKQTLSGDDASSSIMKTLDKHVFGFME